MGCVFTFQKFYKKHLKGFSQVDWPVNLTYIYIILILIFKRTVKV